MKMVYGGYLPVSGVFTDKMGKEIEWKNIKILLSADGSRAGLYKAPYSEEFIGLLRSLPSDILTEVSFDFYGNVEALRRIEGGVNHA